MTPRREPKINSDFQKSKIAPDFYLFEFKLKLNKLPDRYSCNVRYHFEENFILIINPLSLYSNIIIDLTENCL